MAGVKNQKTLSIREEWAIRLHIFTHGDISPRILYTLAYAGSLDDVGNLSDLPANASRWWRSGKVQAFYQTEKAAYDARKDAERKRIEQEAIDKVRANLDGTATRAGEIDYSRPENQLAKLNSIIATSPDLGEQLDALKVMITKQADIIPQERKGAQVRAYVPIRCAECDIKRLFAKWREGGTIERMREAGIIIPGKSI